MSDILNKIVAVKHQEVATARQRKSLEAMRADAESRVLTRDFVGALRAKVAAGFMVIENNGSTPDRLVAVKSWARDRATRL